MPTDFGPLYLETDLTRFPVEPWNTASNLIFLLIFIYWTRKIKSTSVIHPLLRVSLPVLFVGFVGGTLYHATRSSPVWLFLDFMPILAICVYVSISYWRRILGNTLLAFLVVLGPYLLAARGASISGRYALLGLSVVAPWLITARKNRWAGMKSLALALGFFGVALCCRIADSRAQGFLRAHLPMGSHWLWHLCGGVATFFAIDFVYQDEVRVARL